MNLSKPIEEYTKEEMDALELEMEMDELQDMQDQLDMYEDQEEELFLLSLEDD